YACINSSPPQSTPFPSTTLFRSLPCAHLFVPLCLEGVEACLVVGGVVTVELLQVLRQYDRHLQHPARVEMDMRIAGGVDIHFDRSEEHTSELQSRENIVWRLLLE